MAHPLLLVQSSGPQGPNEGSRPFADRLREELGPAYEVLFPDMPEPGDPHYGPWSKRLGEVLAGIEGPVVVVGHSLGGSVVVKHLAEGHPAPGIAGLLLVATPFWGEREWEAEWALPEGWPDASSALPPTFIFHSRDDEEAPFAHLELYARRLPDAVARPVDGNGHLFDRGDLNEIIETIRRLSPS